MPTDQGTLPAKKNLKWFIDNIVSLGSALLVVFAIRSSIVEPFKIPSGSMIPTLFVGDFIFVNKFAYGFKLPFSDWFGSPITLIKRDIPKRGDIIVFLFPRDTSLHYIKRVVGTPGDTVEVKNKILYVNGQAMDQTPVDPAQASTSIQDVADPRYGENHIAMFREKLGDHDHLMWIDKNNEYYTNTNFPATKVPEGSLFVMGDNRDFSNDSRFWGFVPLENVAGKAEIIWLSMWLSFKEKPQFRFSRIGTILR